MSIFSQDFSKSHLKSQYKLIEGHIVNVGQIDLQELYNSLLPNSLDSLLKAFLNPEPISVVDSVVSDNPYQSFDDLLDKVNEYASVNGLEDLSFSEILHKMISLSYESNINDVSGVVSSGDTSPNSANSDLKGV